MLEFARGYVNKGAGAAEGRKVIASWHPSFIRRGAAHLVPHLQRDLRRAFLLAMGRLVEGVHYCLDISSLNLKYQTSPTIDDAWKYVEGLDSELPIAVDVETPMSTRSDEEDRVSFSERDIKLAQFCQRRGEAIAIPFRDEYIDVVKAIMRTPNTKVTHNGWSFDQPVMEANDIEFCGVHDDTMVMWGAYWSDLPRNLQSCAQMAGFPMAWKHLAETDLSTYGCFDADATIWLYDYLKKLLQGEVLE
jgi:hypothetical protein